MLEITTNTEKGKEVNLWLEGRTMMGSMEEIVEDAEISKANVQGYDCISFGHVRYKGETTRVLTKLNDDIAKFLEKAETKIEELKEKEKQEEVVFEVVKTKNSGWTPNWNVLDRKEDKLLSDEQYEKIQELRNILGETALFAGATKHIDVDNLPVEVGETYTLDEIIELCKKYSESWKQAKKEEIKEEEHHQECLEEARETGKNVKLESFAVECNDPNKECNTDIITVYVTPSGRKKEERTHTY